MSGLVAIEGALLEQVLDATYEIWHDGLSRRAYGQWYAAQLATAWGRRHLSRWGLVDGGEVVASAKIYELEASLDGRSLRVHGIGAVFVDPRHRRLGLGAELMQRLLDRAAAQGADAALLFSEIGADYYARLGFEPLPAADLELRVREDARRGAPATMVRAGDDRDLATIAAIDAVRLTASRFHLARDRDLVQYSIAKKRQLAGLAPLGARELQFFIAEEGAEAAAYVVIAVKGGIWSIDSCGDRDPTGARLGAILQVLIARDPTEARPSISAWLPASLRPPQIEVVGASPSKDVMMIRPLTAAARADRQLSVEDVAFWRGDVF